MVKVELRRHTVEAQVVVIKQFGGVEGVFEPSERERRERERVDLEVGKVEPDGAFGKSAAERRVWRDRTVVIAGAERKLRRHAFGDFGQRADAGADAQLVRPVKLGVEMREQRGRGDVDRAEPDQRAEIEDVGGIGTRIKLRLRPNAHITEQADALGPFRGGLVLGHPAFARCLRHDLAADLVADLRPDRFGHAAHAHGAFGHRRRRRRRRRRGGDTGLVRLGLRLRKQCIAVGLRKRALGDQQADEVGHGVRRRRSSRRGCSSSLRCVGPGRRDALGKSAPARHQRNKRGREPHRALRQPLIETCPARLAIRIVRRHLETPFLQGARMAGCLAVPERRGIRTHGCPGRLSSAESGNWKAAHRVRECPVAPLAKADRACRCRWSAAAAPR